MNVIMQHLPWPQTLWQCFGSSRVQSVEAMQLRFVSTNQGKLDFLKIVLEPVIALGVVESVEQLVVNF